MKGDCTKYKYLFRVYAQIFFAVHRKAWRIQHTWLVSALNAHKRLNSCHWWPFILYRKSFRKLRAFSDWMLRAVFSNWKSVDVAIHATEALQAEWPSCNSYLSINYSQLRSWWFWKFTDSGLEVCTIECCGL
jgi:hypothetical protein